MKTLLIIIIPIILCLINCQKQEVVVKPIISISDSICISDKPHVLEGKYVSNLDTITMYYISSKCTNLKIQSYGVKDLYKALRSIGDTNIVNKDYILVCNEDWKASYSGVVQLNHSSESEVYFLSIASKGQSKTLALRKLK